MSTSRGYLLGHEPPEILRLIEQGALLEREVRWLFDEIGARDITAAIDLGCGPLGVIPHLSRMVGPSGRVVGVDADQIMIDHARSHCESRNMTNVELRCADATATGLPDGSFDVAHVRLLLVNIADPAAVLAEAARLVRHGGIVVVQEVDWLSWQCEPPHPDWQRLRTALHQRWNQRGFDPCIGRRLPQLLRETGLADVQAMAHAGIDHADTPYQQLLLSFAERFGRDLVALGLLSHADLTNLTETLRAHLNRHDTIVIRALTVQAWGTRPCSSG